ncbi:MAG: UDP-2,3-diacylglucosamine diphosphatase [Burkholderiaceae bacterium]
MAQPNQLRPAGAGGPVKAASDTCRLSSAKRVRTLWLSDLHLGTTGCQAQHLLDFLEQYEAETIYLVGDIIDGWQLRRRWVWDPVQHRVLMHFIDAAGRGTRVIFVPGNHDEFARPFDGMVFAGIVVRREAVHKTVDGRRLLVVHGDQFDGIVGHARWLALLGDSLYTSALWLNRHFNRARASLGLGYWSLSQYLKHRVKNAVSFICDYERALVEEARRRGVDGVICGHIHKAELREFDGLTYANCGDWVESLTALVEWHDGRLSLLAWSDCAAVDAVADTRREQRAVEEVA